MEYWQMLSYQINTQGLTGADPSLREIVLGVEYIDTTNNYSAGEWFVLTAEEPSRTWEFDPGSATAGTVFYQGILVSTDGSTVTPISPTVASSETKTILVGTGVPPLYTIAIVPVQVDWTRISTADVTIDTNNFRFTSSNTAAQYISLDSSNYSYKVVYTLKDSSTTYTVEASPANSPVLLFPVLPPLQPVSFEVTAQDVSSLPIESIKLTVQNPRSQPLEHTFTSSQTQPYTAEIFATLTDGNWGLDYSYDYTVTYERGSGFAPFNSGTFSDVNDNSVSITEVGIREFALAADVIGGSSIITEVKVNYTSGGESRPPVSLPNTLIANTNYVPFESFEYWLEFTIYGTPPGAPGPQTGNYIQRGIDSSPPPYIYVTNPLQPKQTVFTATLSGNTTIQLTPFSEEDGNLGFPPQQKWKITGPNPGTQTLSVQQPSYTYGFQAIHDTTAGIKYVGILQSDNFYQFEAFTTDTSVTLTADQLPFSITIDPSLVNWQTVTEVQVEIWVNPNQKRNFTFTQSSGFKYFSDFYLVDQSQPLYSYEAVYQMLSGGQTRAQADNQIGTILILPPQGS
ncbi:hypothetical protein [Moorena sp. SIO3I6]|uniref:hypothetical protein n=1 Tax=Moorena sp. SIO3I6 TaxID=2607831 RepID=UPI0013FBF4B6|nr:hypothetical protein [Moorena sp. SIO3I6]NEP26034.1 hypothetical protein [Moorena sp. SIO3I6]